ncbi:MAG: HlyD family secretion protein, partial [Pseudomonadales bacterium]|nr:HlyD family secretion protein [Pseudomonadales bacterium]
ELDDGTYRAGVIRSEAQLRSIKNQVESDKAELRQRDEELALAEDNAAFTSRELDRLQKLKQEQAVSESVLDAARHDRDVATRQVAVLKQQRAVLLAKLAGDPNLPPEQHPDYVQAFAEHAVVSAAVEHCRVKAPFAGIASKTPQVGQYATSGAPIMSIVSDSKVWVEANLKETDLTNVRVGQPVKLHVDAYPDRTFDGVVDSISQATGSEFSILPAQNATGNWVKVVQRVPLRIRVTSRFDDAPLRAGTSTTVDIDTSDVAPALRLGDAD